jgi:hypothetical protein
MKNSNHLSIQKLQQTESSKLIGGFSSAFSDFQDDTTKVKVNNCNGGNVKAGCGHKSNKPSSASGQNKNCHGNCVKGCGDKDTLKTH